MSKVQSFKKPNLQTLELTIETQSPKYNVQGPTSKVESSQYKAQSLKKAQIPNFGTPSSKSKV